MYLPVCPASHGTITSPAAFQGIRIKQAQRAGIFIYILQRASEAFEVTSPGTLSSCERALRVDFGSSCAPTIAPRWASLRIASSQPAPPRPLSCQEWEIGRTCQRRGPARQHHAGGQMSISSTRGCPPSGASTNCKYIHCLPSNRPAVTCLTSSVDNTRTLRSNATKEGEDPRACR